MPPLPACRASLDSYLALSTPRFHSKSIIQNLISVTASKGMERLPTIAGPACSTQLWAPQLTAQFHGWVTLPPVCHHSTAMSLGAHQFQATIPEHPMNYTTATIRRPLELVL
ncbi:hypothetical protein E2C01_041077 [Portunus trituberculatus]|uniref:Uncharacterized protein n=1 Tax=Portunus trituberculatus TaxID=210409 RepID=A0A5B7FPC6_PORTR|nr:hypothetical protein [Portunus trituberculatus]